MGSGIDFGKQVFKNLFFFGLGWLLCYLRAG